VISGSFVLGSGPSNALQISGSLIVVNDAMISGNLTIYKNLQVMGTISGDVNVANIDSTNITSGTINSARLPPPYDLQYFPADYQAGRPPDSNPRWIRIATITKNTNEYVPIKFNIIGGMGSGGPYGWGATFDEVYYLRYMNPTLTNFHASSYRISYVSVGQAKLGFIRVTAQVTDVYFYQELNQYFRGSILFNKYSSDLITTYLNEPILTEDPGVTFLSTRFATVPSPPASGQYALQSRDGVLSWV
jgi:hypothetical protein